MEILGHSQIAITMNIYSHVMPEMEQEAANRLDALLGDQDESDENQDPNGDLK